MYLTAVLILVFVAVLAFMVNEGLWTNFIMFFNVIMAALIAMNYWEPISNKLDEWDGSFTYIWDFLAIWLVFAVSLGILRLITDRLSTVRVRFFKPVEIFGGIFFGLWTGWIMVCFTLATLHMAPLVKNSFGGDFQPKLEDRMFFGIGPDIKWLAFCQKLSDGAYQNSPAYEFDPQGDFVHRYNDRRTQVAKEPDLRVNRPKK